jgi:glycosyltransferase involved in cell wall biosynthesis
MTLDFSRMRLSFIGSAGIPNRYGGFESFLEHCGPEFAAATQTTIVTCDASLYPGEQSAEYRGVKRLFIRVPAGGVASIMHDLLAFMRVFHRSTHIMVLGVSGGPWFPLFLTLCRLSGKRLGVNIDGVEWRRTKYSMLERRVLRLFDRLAQRFSDVVVYDNAGLVDCVLPAARRRAVEIGYPGDHVKRLIGRTSEPGTALTICRIVPENNIGLLIEGALRSDLLRYTVVGNWNHSVYGRSLRERYADEPRLRLLDPIFEPECLADLRERCALYLHGHSVGGTNPSLVEMLFYDCTLLCFDVSYNRATAGAAAIYFNDAQTLEAAIYRVINGHASVEKTFRELLRRTYTRKAIVEAYLRALSGQSLGQSRSA